MTDEMQTTCEQEANFLQWFCRSGGKLDSRCRLQPVEGMGRGMIAMQPIKAGETLFVIPRQILLNLTTSTLPKRCQEAEEEITGKESDSKTLDWTEVSKLGWVPLILAMMYEHRKASVLSTTSTTEGDVSMEDIGEDIASSIDQQSWKAYFDIMPTEFSTPMFWPPQDLQHLEGTSIVDKIARQEAEADYNHKALPYIRSLSQVFLDGVQSEQIEQELAKWYSLETYHVMGSRVLSRSFHVKARQQGLEGRTVDMDIEEQESDDDKSEQEVLEDEGEGDEADQGAVVDDIADEANLTTDTKDDDDEDSDDDEDDEDERENVADISMTPMADMLNARFESDNARLFYKSQVLEMRATKDIGAGDQIFNTYADPPNSDLLRRYGHVDEPNGNDVVEMDARFVVQAAANMLISTVKLNAAEVQKDLAERLEWACSSLGIDEVLILNYLFTPARKAPHRPHPERPTARELKAAATGGGISEEMVALARILCMSRDSFDRAKSKGKGPSARLEAQEEHLLGKTEKGLKISVAQLLMNAIDLRLREYGDDAGISTISLAEVEEAKLYGTKRSEIMSNRHRQALVVRLGEKRVLLDQRRVLKYVVDRLAEADKIKAGSGASDKRKATAHPKAKPQKKGR